MKNPSLENRKRIEQWTFPVQYLKNHFPDAGVCALLNENNLNNFYILRRAAENNLQGYWQGFNA